MFFIATAIILSYVMAYVMVSCVSEPPRIPTEVSVHKSFEYNDTQKKQGSIVCGFEIESRQIDFCIVYLDKLEILVGSQLEQDVFYREMTATENILEDVQIKQKLSKRELETGDSKALAEISASIFNTYVKSIVNTSSKNVFEISTSEFSVNGLRYPIETESFPYYYTAKNKEGKPMLKTTVGVSVLFDSFAYLYIPTLEYEDRIETEVDGETEFSYEYGDLDIEKIYFNQTQLHDFNETFKNIIHTSEEEKERLVQEVMVAYNQELKTYNEEHDN